MLGWNLTTEIYAATGEHDFSARLAKGMIDPPNWIDRTVNGGTVTALGQQVTDPDRCLADRVLEPLGEEVLDYRRQRRRPGADAHP